MHHLVIDYVLEGEGPHPGYNFITPTDHIAPDILREVWRNAMPRGKGWRDYTGARSLKTILLPRGRVAVSEVTVTATRDEKGRRGIRRADVTLMHPHEYSAHLQDRWNRLPPTTRDTAEERFGLRTWKRIIDEALPKIARDAQLVLAAPYQDPRHWQVVEAFVLKLMLSRRLRLIKGWGGVNPFTTLALDYRHESRLVVLPRARAATIGQDGKVSVIDIG